jgi:hypothetical protein
MLIDLFRPPRDDSLQHSHDGLRLYPGSCDICPIEHLDLFYEEDFLPPLCSDFDENEAVICLGQLELHTTGFWPSPLSSSFRDPVGNCVLHDDLSIGQGCFQLKVCCMDFWNYSQTS